MERQTERLVSLLAQQHKVLTSMTGASEKAIYAAAKSLRLGIQLAAEQLLQLNHVGRQGYAALHEQLASAYGKNRRQRQFISFTGITRRILNTRKYFRAADRNDRGGYRPRPGVDPRATPTAPLPAGIDAAPQQPRGRGRGRGRWN